MPKNQSAVIRWSGTGVLVLTAIGLFVTSNVIDAQHEASLERQSAEVVAAEERVVLAEAKREALPDESSARSLLSAAKLSGESVAKIQNGYGPHQGELSFDGVPLGEKDLFGKIQPYSQEQRTKLAEEARARAIDELDRSTLPFFVQEDTDSEGYDASKSWSKTLGLGDQARQLTWTSIEARWFTDTENVPMLWELRDKDGALQGWASATWSNKTKTMSGFTLSTGEGE